MEEWGKDGFRPEGGAAMSFGASRRCCRPYANRCHRVFLGSSCRSSLHGWIPMAADGSVDPLEKIFRLPDPSASGAPLDSLRSPFAAKKFFAFGRVPRALALCPRLAVSALFCRSGRYGHRNLAQAPEHVGLNQHGQGARRCFRFRLSSVNSTVACPVM